MYKAKDTTVRQFTIATLKQNLEARREIGRIAFTLIRTNYSGQFYVADVSEKFNGNITGYQCHLVGRNVVPWPEVNCICCRETN